MHHTQQKFCVIRARKNGNGGELTASDIREAYATWPICLRCGTSDNLSIDHVIPVALGGRNAIENTQVLCRSCNSSKGVKIIDYRKISLGGWRQTCVLE